MPPPSEAIACIRLFGWIQSMHWILGDFRLACIRSYLALTTTYVCWIVGDLYIGSWVGRKWRGSRKMSKRQHTFGSIVSNPWMGING